MSRLMRLRNRFRRSSLDREFDEELRFHLERRIDDSIRLGMEPEEAKADACRRFGSIDSARDGMRRARTVHGGPVVIASVLVTATILVVLVKNLPLSPTGVVYELGDTVSAPVPIETPKPEYTGAARQARIQGAVRVQCVVQPAGDCSAAEIVASLDRAHGLDDQAIRAARRWRFRPALLKGNPVATRIVLEFSFALR